MRKKSSAEALIIGRCANDTQGLPLGSLTTIGQETIENQKVKVKIQKTIENQKVKVKIQKTIENQKGKVKIQKTFQSP